MATSGINNISTFTDYGAAQQDIERRRKLAEALQMQSMQPLESQGMAGGAPIPISPYAGLAKMLNAYTGAMGQKRAGEEQTALGQRYRTDRAQELSSALALGESTPAQPERTVGDPLQEGEMFLPAREAKLGNRDAMLRALAGSQFPDLQGIGMTQLLKQQEDKVVGPGASLVRGSTPVYTAPFKPDAPKEHVIEGKVYVSTPNGLVEKGGPGKPTPPVDYNKPFLADGTPNKAFQDYSLTRAKAGSTNVNMPPQERGFETALGKGQATELIDGRKAADDAKQIITTVHQGRDIIKKGMTTGFGANVIVGIGQALKQAGVDFGGDATANAQAYGANMAGNVGKIIKQFGSGTGLSDADREYATKMAGGLITLDQRAIEKILDINERQARWVIQRHNSRAEGVKTNIPLKVEEPAPYGAKTVVRTGTLNGRKVNQYSDGTTDYAD